MLNENRWIIYPDKTELETKQKYIYSYLYKGYTCCIISWVLRSDIRGVYFGSVFDFIITAGVGLHPNIALLVRFLTLKETSNCSSVNYLVCSYSVSFYLTEIRERKIR